MSCACDRPIPGNRHPETCAKCAKVIPENPLPDQLVSDFFDHLRETLEAAGKIHRPAIGEPEDPRFAWFETRAKQRLIRGAETYGNRNFLKPAVNLPEEFIQEMLDAGNYALMMMVKDAPDDCAKVPLGMAVLHAIMGAFCMLDYEVKMRGSA